MNQKISTPWGQSHYVREITPDIVQVGTSGHGGIGVRLTLEMPEYLASPCDSDGTWRWYEEDNCWCIPVVAFPLHFDAKMQADAKNELCHSFPELYEKHYGVKPTAEMSNTVRERELNEQLKSNYRPRAAFGDWAWDVPKGFCYIVGQRASDNSTKGFLVPDAEYKNCLTMVLDGYQEWKPDESLPRSKLRLAA